MAARKTAAPKSDKKPAAKKRASTKGRVYKQRAATTVRPEPKRKRGRPKGSTKVQMSPELVKQVQAVGRLQCTQKELAAVLDVSQDTITNMFRLHPELAEAFEKGKQEGCVSLRRTQLRMAEQSATMAIWCGKQYLNQADKSENKNESTVDANVTSDDGALELLYSRIAGIAERNGTD